MANLSHEEKLAQALGWASLGLGAAMIAVPGQLNRLAGIRDDATARRWQRIVGVRELAAFAAIALGGQRPRAQLWARVSGDAKDLALLGLAARSKRQDALRLAAATTGIAAVTALDTYAAVRLSGDPTEAPSAPQEPPDDLSKDPAYEPPEHLKGIKGG